MLNTTVVFCETTHWCDKYQQKQIQIGNTTKTTFEWPEWKAIKERWKDELDQDKETNAADWKDFWYFLFYQIICIHMKKEKFSYRSSFVDLKNMILFLIVGSFMHIYNHIDETLIKNIEFNTTHFSFSLSSLYIS